MRNAVMVGVVAITVWLACGVLPAYAGSSNEWIYDSTYPTSNTLLGVKFISAKEGWVVGTSGTILHTVDGGTNWEVQESGTERDLKAVTFINDKTGWVVGLGGTILQTKDGGRHWSAVQVASQLKEQGPVNFGNVGSSGQKHHLHKVFFLNEREGWVGGDDGFLLYTSDGGERWEERTVYTHSPIAGIFFVNAQTGWILAGGRVHRTVDGGKEWIAAGLPVPARPTSGSFSPPEEFSWWGGLFFLNEKKGWAIVDRQSVFRTEDGGKTWQGTDELGVTVTSLAFPGEKNGCVGGSSILCTEDGGKTWVERLGIKTRTRNVINGSLINIQGMSFSDANNGWAVGGNGMVGGSDVQILKTEDGGKNWRMISRNNVNAYFVDSKVGWFVQYDTKLTKSSLVGTVDGGITWVTQKQFEHYVNIEWFFIDKLTGWAAGEQFGHNSGGTTILDYFILKTSDGGKTWIIQLEEPSGHYNTYSDALLDIHFINRDIGWIVGSKGRIYHTEDGGQHWVRQKSNNKFDLKKIQFVDAKRGWVAGEQFHEKGASGIILHTDNGGMDWKQQWIKKTEYMWIFGLQFVDADNGWAAICTDENSKNCLLIQTVDGGKTWSERKLNVINPMEVVFYDKDYGMVIADNDIFVTKDGGTNWTRKIKSLHKYPWNIYHE